MTTSAGSGLGRAGSRRRIILESLTDRGDTVAQWQSAGPLPPPSRSAWPGPFALYARARARRLSAHWRLALDLCLLGALNVNLIFPQNLLSFVCRRRRCSCLKPFVCFAWQRVESNRN